MILALALTLAVANDAAALAGTFNGRDNQLKVAVPRLDESVSIDGVLDEPAWSQAAVLTGFSQYAPVDDRPAAQRTDVLVFYSASAIHFGIRAHAAPGSVRASLAQRDKTSAEDLVTVFLSTFNDGRQASVFSVNPLGVQSDGTLVEGTGSTGAAFSGLSTQREEPDLSPDFVFQSKGRLTDFGFEVELRIPFKSLRFQSGASQDWGLHVVRKVQSSGYEDSWAPARRASASFLAQGGTLTGIHDLRPGLVLDLNPVVTAKIDGARNGDRWSYDSDRPEFGGNVRWGVTPNLTLNGTVNPDFSQVEADASQIQYDPRDAIFFPEKRPFFLDGLELFTTPNRLIYTRRVVAPLGALKVTGKVSGTNVGLLSAVDDRATSRQGDHPLFNVLRVQRDVFGQSRLGLVYTDKVDGADSNRVGGLDTHLTFAKIYSLDLQGAFSRTEVAGARSTAPLFEGVFKRNGRRLGTRAILTGIDKDFRALAGFVRRPGIVHANVDQRVTFFGKKNGRIETWNTDLSLDGTWKFDAFFGEGGIQDKKLHVNNNFVLRGGWNAGFSVLVESYGYDPDLYVDYALQGDRPGERLPFMGTPRLPNLDYVAGLTTPDFKRFSGNVQFVWGKDENFYEWSSGNIAYVTLGADWRPTGKLRANLSYNLQSVSRRSDGSRVARRQIPRLKLEYQATRAIFARVVAEYDARFQDDLRDDSRTGRPILIKEGDSYVRALGSRQNGLRIDALFAWQPNPGTVFFAGYGGSLVEPKAFEFRDLSRTNDGFFVKFSYLFRL